MPGRYRVNLDAMAEDSIIYILFLIFCGAALLATLAMMVRQSLIIAYIGLGLLIGPWGLQLITDISLIQNIANIGIIFLLFLLGLDMQPGKLISMLRKAALVGVGSSLVFALVGFAVSQQFGFDLKESIIIGIAMMFSSTIIGIKLIPTTVLHHRHTGELVVSLLLIQDLFAIIVLLVLGGGLTNIEGTGNLVQAVLALPALILFSFGFVKFVLLKLLQRFDAFHEYIFLVAIGWCLGLAEIALLAGLSLEIGAFIAGISIATSPIALYIANSLKPLRDFFLVLFFFSLGASFDLQMIPHILLPTCLLSVLVLAGKPFIFRVFLQRVSETLPLAWEIGFRLGQISEFSLLIAFIAARDALIGQQASHVIQATAILTFLVSSYLVVFRYPTPIAISDRLRRD
jgi:Kef-type K+ transport system membrane component KefB